MVVLPFANYPIFPQTIYQFDKFLQCRWRLLLPFPFYQHPEELIRVKFEFEIFSIVLLQQDETGAPNSYRVSNN